MKIAVRVMVMVACGGVAVACSQSYTAKQSGPTTGAASEARGGGGGGGFGGIAAGPGMVMYEGIEPKVSLPTSRPTTEPAPVEALDWFGRARGAMLEGRRFTALQMAEKAAGIDPNSAEIQRLLAQLYVEAEGAGGNGLEKASVALTKAAELDPDDLETWVKLGRVEMARDHKLEGLTALRKAALTKEYDENRARGALVDLYLARALAVNGFDRAALDRYDRVLKAIASLGPAVREVSEVALVAQRPDLLYSEVGTLYERHGQYKDAARVLEQAAREDEDSFETQARWVRMLVKAGGAADLDRAVKAVGNLVVRFRADERSMGLMREVYKAAGREQSLLGELRRMYDQRPGDRAMLLALVQGLESAGRTDEAERLIATRAIGASGASEGERSTDVELTRKLVEMRKARGDLLGAASAIISASAAAPELLPEMQDLMDDLTRPQLDGRIRLAALGNLDVGEKAAGARDVFVARLATQVHRSTVARDRLQAASKTYAPAVLWAAEDILSRRFSEDATRRQELAALTERARSLGGEGLALAVQGRQLLAQGRSRIADAEDKNITAAAIEAARVLEDAVAKGATDVSTRLWLVFALQRANRAPDAEAVLAKLSDEHPRANVVQGRLVDFYLNTGRGAEAERALEAWLLASPNSALAKATQSLFLMQFRRDTASAIKLADEILENHPDVDEALQAAESVYSVAGRTQDWQGMVVRRFETAPRVDGLLERVVAWGIATGKPEDAKAAVQKSRQACADDADLLYGVGAVCEQFDIRPLAREILEDVVKLDPQHPPGCNDLAFETSELPGITRAQLAQCERMSTIALKAEPDNAAYVDTLGWIYYKQGRYSEAEKELARAANLAAKSLTGGDPTVQDHLGDARWRAGQKDKALEAWKAALAGLSRRVLGRETDSTLRVLVEGKIRAAEAGGDPSVAIIAEQ